MNLLILVCLNHKCWLYIINELEKGRNKLKAIIYYKTRDVLSELVSLAQSGHWLISSRSSLLLNLIGIWDGSTMEQTFFLGTTGKRSAYDKIQTAK